jgi:hypothetical protein
MNVSNVIDNFARCVESDIRQYHLMYARMSIRRFNIANYQQLKGTVWLLNDHKYAQYLAVRRDLTCNESHRRVRVWREKLTNEVRLES